MLCKYDTLEVKVNVQYQQLTVNWVAILQNEIMYLEQNLPEMKLCHIDVKTI